MSNTISKDSVFAHQKNKTKLASNVLAGLCKVPDSLDSIPLDGAKSKLLGSDHVVRCFLHSGLMASLNLLFSGHDSLL